MSGTKNTSGVIQMIKAEDGVYELGIEVLLQDAGGSITETLMTAQQIKNIQEMLKKKCSIKS